jgi:hypothetical protein
LGKEGGAAAALLRNQILKALCRIIRPMNVQCRDQVNRYSFPIGRVDLRQNCRMLDYRQEGVLKNSRFLIFQNRKNGGIADCTYESSDSPWMEG